MSMSLDLRKSLGININSDANDIASIRPQLLQYINLQLIASGQPDAADSSDSQFAEMAHGLLDKHRAQSRLLSDHRCPVDTRIESFLEQYFADLNLREPLRLPHHTLIVRSTWYGSRIGPAS